MCFCIRFDGVEMPIVGMLGDTGEIKHMLSEANDRDSDDRYRIETVWEQPSPLYSAVWQVVHISDVIVAVISQDDESILYQIGLAHGAGKPVVIVAHNKHALPVELRGHQCLDFPESAAKHESFSFRLREAIKAAIKSKSGYLGLREGGDDIRHYVESSHYFHFKQLFSYPSGASRARAFEKWFATMAEGIPGWEVIESEQTSGKGFDLVIWNSLDDSELSVLGNPIPVEIKAVRTMSDKLILDLLARSEALGLKGLVLATTASNPKRSEQKLRAYSREKNISVICLDREDLLEVQNPNQLLAVMKSKLRELLYYKGF
ncbi:hypothetical protein [Thalassospira povalilytica]|uniref:Uncharacterized protein n=1 Tax=Thalassospira povalilytica TaxID=732237 RepID=A0A8I1MAB5_9PROT|nr:hypothetical protein [Thalassospira povalilytica]MBN8197760.1 hypothetical protein [Thalassospira povalilytica]